MSNSKMSNKREQEVVEETTESDDEQLIVLPEEADDGQDPNGSDDEEEKPSEPTEEEDEDEPADEPEPEKKKKKQPAPATKASAKKAPSEEKEKPKQAKKKKEGNPISFPEPRYVCSACGLSKAKLSKKKIQLLKWQWGQPSGGQFSRWCQQCFDTLPDGELLPKGAEFGNVIVHRNGTFNRAQTEHAFLFTSEEWTEFVRDVDAGKTDDEPSTAPEEKEADEEETTCTMCHFTQHDIRKHFRSIGYTDVQVCFGYWPTIPGTKNRVTDAPEPHRPCCHVCWERLKKGDVDWKMMKDSKSRYVREQLGRTHYPYIFWDLELYHEWLNKNAKKRAAKAKKDNEAFEKATGKKAANPKDEMKEKPSVLQKKAHKRKASGDAGDEVEQKRERKEKPSVLQKKKKTDKKLKTTGPSSSSSSSSSTAPEAAPAASSVVVVPPPAPQPDKLLIEMVQVTLLYRNICNAFASYDHELKTPEVQKLPKCMPDILRQCFACELNDCDIREQSFQTLKLDEQAARKLVLKDQKQACRRVERILVDNRVFFLQESANNANQKAIMAEALRKYDAAYVTAEERVPKRLDLEKLKNELSQAQNSVSCAVPPQLKMMGIEVDPTPFNCRSVDGKHQCPVVLSKVCAANDQNLCKHHLLMNINSMDSALFLEGRMDYPTERKKAVLDNEIKTLSNQVGKCIERMKEATDKANQKRLEAAAAAAAASASASAAAATASSSSSSSAPASNHASAPMDADETQSQGQSQ